MLDDVLPYLACTYCGAALTRDGGSLRCGAGHRFDIARQGYVSLLPAGPATSRGDTAAMVQARCDVLAAGHFAGLADDLGRAATDADRGMAGPAAGAIVEGCVTDVGAGTGFYLAAVLDRLPHRAGLALDISRFALRRAVRAHPRIGAVRCDAWCGLPVADSAAALVLNVFAPRNGAEMHRILSPAGRLLVVIPQHDHLGEIVRPLGLLSVDERKQERLAASLQPYFEPVGRRDHRVTLPLGREAIAALVAMGPSARHADGPGLTARIARLPEPSDVTLAVTLTVYRPAEGADFANRGDRRSGRQDRISAR